MPVPKVLILGAAGQLGRALAEEFKTSHDSFEVVRRSPEKGQSVVDLSDTAGMTNLLRRTQPQWVLIAAAFCNVDLCETEQEQCRRVNSTGPRRIAEWAGEHGAKVVYYSTDHVFDGTAGLYAEEDRPNPLNVYAASKLEGEQAVRELLPDDHLILRTSGLYGPDRARKNFAARLVDQLRAGTNVRVPSDQWGSPTFTQDLARVTRFLLENSFHGTFHAVGPDFLPRIQFARQICSAFGLKETLLTPVETSQLNQTARRPLRVQLKTDRLAGTGAPALRPVAEGLTALK